MTLNLIKSLEAENSLRGKMVYLPHTNKSITKAQNNGWLVNNTTRRAAECDRHDQASDQRRQGDRFPPCRPRSGPARR